MKKKHGMMFFDGDLSRGSAVFEPVVEPNVEPVAPASPEPAAAPAATPAPAAPAATTPSVSLPDLTAAIKSAFPQPQAPAAPQMTKEEAAKLLNVFEFTPEWAAKFGNLETQGAALAELRDGLIRQADTIAQIRLHEQQQALEQRYSPVLEFMQQYQAQQAEQRFNEKYPVLAKPELRPVIVAVAQGLKAQGATFADENAQFEALAKGVESFIKATVPQFTLQSATSPAPAAQPQQNNGRPSGAIPVTTPGGGGGGGNSPSGAPTKARGLAIFDK